MLISRADAEQRRKQIEEVEFDLAIEQINDGIVSRFQDDENFGFPIEMTPKTRSGIVEVFRESKDWSFISHVKGVLTLRSKNRGSRP